MGKPDFNPAASPEKTSNLERVKRFLIQPIAGKWGPFRIEVLHLSGVKGEPAIDDRTVDPGETDWDNDGEARAMLDGIKENASTYPGDQRYQIRLSRADDETVRPLMLSISVKGGEGIPGDGSVPSVTLNLMRHNEALMKMALDSAKVASAAYEKLNERLLDRIDKVELAQIEVIDLYASLAKKQHEQALETKKSEAVEARKDKAFSSFLPMVGPIIGRLFGKKGATAAIPASMKVFLESLTEEQLSALGEQLNDAQKISFVEMIAAMQGEGK